MTRVELGRIDKTKPHLLADTAEILCATNGGLVSVTDLVGLIASSVSPAEEAMNADEQDRDDDGVPDDEPSTATTARHTLYAEECFRQLEYRQDAFGVSYPFEVQGKTLRLRKEYHVLQCLYLFLLYASRTRTFKGRRGITQEIADYFEIVGRDALSRLMAPSAEVIMFGPNSADRSTRFGTDLRQALPKLAEFMGIYMAPGWKPEDEAAQGDANIDLVGVQKLDNTKGGWNLFLAQCAAHEKHETWEKKRLEADLSYHNARFHSLVRAQAVLFVPTCFRQTSGDWVDKSAAANVILMDRLRIISAVNDDDPSVEGSCDFLQDKQLAGPFRGDRLSASA